MCPVRFTYHSRTNSLQGGGQQTHTSSSPAVMLIFMHYLKGRCEMATSSASVCTLLTKWHDGCGLCTLCRAVLQLYAVEFSGVTVGQVSCKLLQLLVGSRLI